MKKLFTFLLIASFAISLNAQKKESATAFVSTKVTSMIHVSSIASRPHDQIPITLDAGEMKDGRSKNQPKLVIGKDPQKTNDALASNPNALEQKIQGKAPSLVFDAASSNSNPTDPALAVGPNHVFVVFNTGFRIFAKDGTPLTGQINPNPAIFPNGGCCDLTVSYDNLADRWVVTFLGNGMQVAVSDGPDPVNDGWYVYNVAAVSDYNKLSVWRDGYYVTQNVNGATKVFALERDKMLLGDASAQVVGFPLPGMITSGFHSPQAFNITDDNHPAAGDVTFVYMQDDAWSGVSQDHIKLWQLNMDWAAGNGVMSVADTINLDPFISVFDNGQWQNIQQPNGGTLLDALQATIMNQAQFRKFASHNSALFNFVVDIDASGGKLAGIRWVELRQANDTAPWTLYQEGTYASPNNKHAWNASLIMDAQGNIGMGYSACAGDNAEFLGMYYTGRHANDPLGTMSVAEEVILEGNANIPSNRYGDYSKIDVDPADDKTFWFIDEMMNSGRKDVVGVFKIAPNFPNDVGVVSIDNPVNGTLGANEDVVVSVFNYGVNSQSNVPVNLTVDGSIVATGTIAGPIASAATVQYTFAGIDFSTEGHTYNVISCTALAGDEETSNDCTTTDITHLNPNDIGVTAIIAPTSDTGLTATETITVEITNFGGAEQTNFDVSYDLDGTLITENVAGPLAGDSTMTYDFMQTGDFSAFGTYALTATTLLANDSDNSNDATTVSITKTSCEPHTNCTLGDGIRLFEVSNINNTSDCGTDGYENFTNIIGNFEVDTTYSLTITTGYGNQFVRVWIDFNDDGTYTLDELVVDNFEIADEEGSGNYTETMNFVVPASATNGQHLMRAKTNWNGPVPDDACEETAYGETEDYTAQIGTVSSVNDDLFTDSEFVVATLTDNQFVISVNNTQINDRLNFTVTNAIGQKLLSYYLDNENGGYKYELDMSYATPGIYIVRLGNAKSGNTRKIIVK